MVRGLEGAGTSDKGKIGDEIGESVVGLVGAGEEEVDCCVGEVDGSIGEIEEVGTSEEGWFSSEDVGEKGAARGIVEGKTDSREDEGEF